jgi:hypothetical protein
MKAQAVKNDSISPNLTYPFFVNPYSRRDWLDY